MDRGYRIHICNVSETAPTTTICPDTTFCVPVSRPLDLNWVALLLRMEWFFYLVAKNEPQRKTRLVYCRCFGKVAFLENLKFGEMLPSLHGVFQADSRINPMKPTVFVILFHPRHPQHRISLSQKHSSPPKKEKLYHLKTDRWRSPLPLYRLGLSWPPYKSSPWEWRQPSTFTPRNFREVAPVPPALLVVVRLMDLVPVQQWALVAMQKPYTCSKKMVDDRGNFWEYMYMYIYICISSKALGFSISFGNMYIHI